MSEEPAERKAKEGRSGKGGAATKAEAPPGPRLGGVALVWGIVFMAFVAAVGFAVFVIRRNSTTQGGADAANAQPARITGQRCDYSIELPAGWKRVDAGGLGAAAPGDLDMMLFKEGLAAALVLVEEIPGDVVIGSDTYFERIVATTKRNAPGTTFLEDEPLPQDPDHGVMVRVRMQDEKGPREGYLVTLLTPKWGFRIVATAPIQSFESSREEIRRLLGTFAPPPSSVPPRATFEEARRTPTRLVRRGPSPQPYEKEPLPTGVEKVQYSSGPLSLQGYYLPPQGAPSGKVPALVYLHGGFAFGNDDLEVPRLFAGAGFAAFVPTYRGENGNPGEYELFRGELDDAAAAIRWLAARSEVDPGRIHVFGHSAGGGLAGLVALLSDVPVKSTGSAGGVYDEEVFIAWQKAGRVPFDPLDPAERRVRVLGPFLREIRRAHHVYAGEQDSGAAEAARTLAARARRLGKPVYVETVPGDHQGSLLPAAKKFLAAIQGQ